MNKEEEIEDWEEGLRELLEGSSNEGIVNFVKDLLKSEKQQYRQEILKWAKDRTYDKNGRCKAEIGQTTNQDAIEIQNYLMKKLKELINKDYE